MGANDWVIPTVLGLVVIGGGYFLLFTKHGRGLISDVFGETEETVEPFTFTDPFQFYEENPKAWKPGSKAWRRIQKRIYEDKDDKKNKRDEDIQKRYIESYFVEDFTTKY